MWFFKNYTQICAVFPSINSSIFQRQKEKYIRIITTGFNTFSGSAFNVHTKQWACVFLQINVIVETALESFVKTLWLIKKTKTTFKNKQTKEHQPKHNPPKNPIKEKLCLIRCKNISSIMYRGYKFTVRLGK